MVVSKSNHKFMALSGSTERLDLSSSQVAEVKSKGEHVFTQFGILEAWK